MIRLVLVTVLTLALWASPSTAGEADSDVPVEGEDARAVVEALQGVLIECMKEASALGFDGRAERIGEALPKSFDLPFVARTGIGGLWKELTVEQHREFIELNRKLTAARYADNFDGYGGQHFETNSVKPAARATIMVKTTLVQPDDSDVRFDYRLRKSPVGWRIIDVVIEGSISEFVLWRGQYRSVLENEGYEKLVEAMEGKIAKLSGG